MTTSKPKNDELDVIYQETRRHVGGPFARVYTAPWWLLIMAGLLLWVIYQMANDPDYSAAFTVIVPSIPLTIWLAVASYSIALVIGLFTGILRASPPKPPDGKVSINRRIRSYLYVALYNVVTFYIEFMRGIPSLVFLLIAGFIVIPMIREPFEQALNSTLIPFLRLFDPEVEDVIWRGRDPATAIAGLSLIYGAFLSEIFRAGIQGIPKGQVEAAKSLGMTNIQTMRLVVIPQAVRNVLPPLGNDFIAMIKDTSLVTILGTNDVTQAARRWAGSQFTYLQTYAVLSMIYLMMTVTGSLLVQVMERYLRRFAKR